MAKRQKKMKGQPELYDEVKQRVNFALTPTAVERLEGMVAVLGLPSRSEFVEQIARGIIPIRVEGIHQLDAIANSFSMSSTELMEKIAQGTIKLQVD